MPENQRNPKVDDVLRTVEKWRDEFDTLRQIVLDCNLTEALKWGWPCYMFQKQNIVLIHGFKEYCALLFFKGALLKDENSILIKQTENVQAARQIRFTKVGDIVRMEPILKAYVEDAIAVEKSGLTISFKKTADFPRPEEFHAQLNGNPSLRNAFEALTPGRQRAYLLHFSSAKQSSTRQSRIEKCIPKILNGKGLDD